MHLFHCPDFFQEKISAAGVTQLQEAMEMGTVEDQESAFGTAQLPGDIMSASAELTPAAKVMQRPEARGMGTVEDPETGFRITQLPGDIASAELTPAAKVTQLSENVVSPRTTPSVDSRPEHLSNDGFSTDSESSDVADAAQHFGDSAPDWIAQPPTASGRRTQIGRAHV